MPWDPQVWTESLQQMASDALALLPNLAVALLLLLLGWVVARITEAVVSSLLRRMGVDRLAERAGGAQVLEGMGLSKSAADALSSLVYWLVLLVFLLAAVESLGLTGVVDTLAGLVNYLPHVFAAALILLLGSLLAKLVGDAAGAMAEQAGVQAGPVVFLILSSLFLAEGLRKHGLTRRLALGTIVGSGGGVGALLLGVMGIAALLSMWVENTATAAVLIPVALTISRRIPEPSKARTLLVLLVFGIAYGASVGGMATIMGSASNAVASGFLAEIQPWTFIDWMKYGFPAFLIVFPLTWAVLLHIVPVEIRHLDVEPVRAELNKLGPATREEREILYTMAGAAFLWVSGSFLEPALGLPPTLLSAAIVAVVAVAVLAVRNVIDWEDVKGVSWGIFLIIGAGLSLGETLTRTGATEWLATLITPIVSGPPLIISLVLMVYLSALLTNLMNNTTIAAVFAPILISLARSDPSLNPVQLVLPVTLATTFGYSLPSASGRMALIAATGIVKRGEMMRYGLIMTLISSGALALFFFGLAWLGWLG